MSPAADASVADASITVSGTASSPDGHPSVTVNGAAVPLAADGSWTTEVPLSEGANAITAVATNAVGVGTEERRTVTRSTPAAPAAMAIPVAQTVAPAAKPVRCKVPKLRGKTLSRAKVLLKRAHCRVGKVTRRHHAKILPAGDPLGPEAGEASAAAAPGSR